ncbi:MAG: SRPBCC family protein [Actinomycetota bacterium]|nr:SRPBCC family protein [Actinomycetota bacterium]
MTPHRYRIYIKANPEQVWQAITDPEYTRQYFHHTAFQSSLAVGAGFRYVMENGSDAVEGTVEVAEPPHRLVHTWRVLYDPAMADEPPSRVEWLLAVAGEGLTRLDVVHGDLARSPLTWGNVQYGWVWILDSMKSLLETGAALPDETEGVPAVADDAEAKWHRTLGIAANNSIWDLFGKEARTADDDEEMLRRAYASAYHWQRAAGAQPINEARARYMLSKAHLLAGMPERALHYADACVAATMAAGDGAADFDHAYAHEVRARALRAVGREQEGLEAWAAAKAVPIADAEDQAIIDGDFADAP